MGAVAPIKNKKFIYPTAFIERPKYDLALLQELIKFNHKGNFDRVMAFMIGMYHTRELYNAEVKEILEDNSANSWFDNNYY